MTTIAVVIPWRPGQPDREHHHQLVRAHLQAILPDALYLDADSGHQPFSRAGSRNHGVRLASQAAADVVLLCDADTLPEPAPVHAAIQQATDGRLHLPYTRYRSLTRAGTRAYLHGTDPLRCPTDHDHQWATGGVLAITPQAWAQAGGMDERFCAWGFEDTAFRVAADTLLGPTVKHQGVIHHLWHPLETALGTPQHLANAALMERYLQAEGDPAAMPALIAERAEEPI